MSDSFGFICGSIFAGYVRIKLLVQVHSSEFNNLFTISKGDIIDYHKLQYMFGFNMHQWKEGSKLNIAYLRTLCELTEANQLQMVVGKVYTPYDIERALLHILDPNSIGSTIITFQ